MKYTLADYKKEYPNEAACMDKVFVMRYGSLEMTCPCCGKDTKFRRVSTRKSYQCRLCYHQLYPCAGTPFEKTRTPLTYWFYVMFMMTTTRNGVASKEVQRALGVTYKCAHRMTTQIRKLMQEFHQMKLKGHVELDETYVSISSEKSRGRGGENKKAVFAAVERLGLVRAKVMDNVKMENVYPYIEENVSKEANVSTDEYNLYKT